MLDARSFTTTAGPMRADPEFDLILTRRTDGRVVRAGPYAGPMRHRLVDEVLSRALIPYVITDRAGDTHYLTDVEAWDITTRPLTRMELT